LFSRVIRKLYEEGWPSVASAVRWRWQRHALDRSPVLWAQFGAASQLLGRAVPPKQPPVVVLSLPRSGSSWVGHTLGQAPNAAYLREPLEQLFLAQGGEAVPVLESGEPPRVYRHAAALTFGGVPAFPRRLRIVSFPKQWALAGRRSRRVVAKSVNPFAFPWLLRTYQPRFIYLVRHPAALALSYRRLGWWSDDPENWIKVGRSYHDAHKVVLSASAGRATVRLVQYETLCPDPITQFFELFEFAGLTWDERVAALILEQTAGGDETDPYSLARNSRAQIDRWRSEIQPHELADVRAGYCHSPLPWYQGAEDWTLRAVTDPR
jgi:hypothetical protein